MPRLLSVNSYHYRRGGADAVYFDHAALFEEEGWENAFFSMHHENNFESKWSKYFVDEIQIGQNYSLLEKVVKATKVVYSFEAQRRIAQLIDDYRPDIAHLHNIYHHLSPSILSTLKSKGVPVVMTAHDLKLACPNNKMLTAQGVCEQCKVSRYHRAIVNKCVQNSRAASTIIAVESSLHRWLDSYKKHVERIVVPSRYFIDKLVQWGWPQEIFRYIPNYVDSERFQCAFEPGQYFVYFGRLAQEKGVATLVKAAAAAKVPLVVVGTGPLESELKSLAAHLQAPIEFVGYQTGDALHKYLANSRANVLPSEWYENAPISVLESMAMGKPSIGARIGGIPEIVRPGESGWLFDSGSVEQLTSLLGEVASMPSNKISSLGRRAREIVEIEFSRKRYVNSMLALYSELGVKMSAATVQRVGPVHAHSAAM
jgi:glycosyltransferase involved in cell wall biosynthesis